MAVVLSEGAVSALMSQTPIDPPILQVLGVKKLNHPGTTDRYRIMLSDGLNSINFAMLATQHNPKIENREISDNCIVKLNHHITSMLNKEGGERRVLIVLDIEVLVPGNEMSKIGNPTMYNDDSAPPPPSTGNASAAPAPQMNGNARPSVTNIERPTKMARLELPQNQETASGGIVTRPISSINPYQNKWTIRALVTCKSPIRTWSNSRGEGSLFSLDLKDESGEIRATAFKDECDKFYPVIDVDKVYYISNCVVKNANKKFSTLKHDFELTFSRDTTVTLVENVTVNIPGLDYKFTPIAQLAVASLEELVDVIGVCKSFGDLNTFVARTTGRELKKRDVTLVDNSGATINLALWAEKAVDFDGTDHPIVALRQARVNEFQGAKSISTGMSTVLTINPNMPEAHRLRGWYDNGGADEPVVNISSNQGGGGSTQGISGDILSLLEAKESHLGSNDSPDFYNAVVSVMSIRRENCYYLACPNGDCKKKVIDNQNGTYRCEKCNKDFEECLPRMIISMNVADWSDNVWVTLFEGDAQQLLGVDGKELRRRKEESEDQFNEVFDNVKFAQMKMRLRVKGEMYNDEKRLKTVAAKLEMLDVKENNIRMLREIKAMKAQGVKVEPTY